jgi:hypothetical protein
MVVTASRLVRAPRMDVFEFLRHLENHWLLADRFIEVLELERSLDGSAHGGRVRMRGPLGLRRTATTRVTATDSDCEISGTAELAGGTRARVSWSLADEGATITRVSLGAEVERAVRIDRLLLQLGGRRWVAGRFAAILDRLALRFV